MSVPVYRCGGVCIFVSLRLSVCVFLHLVYPCAHLNQYVSTFYVFLVAGAFVRTYICISVCDCVFMFAYITNSSKKVAKPTYFILD